MQGKRDETFWDADVDGELPSSPDDTMDKMACIEAMLNRMELTPTASDVLLQRMLGLVNQQDLQHMVQLQGHMLSRFEKTNEMLVNFNVLSSQRYESTCEEFRRHTHLLTAMKTDLDDVFKRIRALKKTLSTSYPEAFKVCEVKNELPEEDEKDELNVMTDNVCVAPSSQPDSSQPSASTETQQHPSQNTTVSTYIQARPRSNTAEIIEGEG